MCIEIWRSVSVMHDGTEHRPMSVPIPAPIEIYHYDNLNVCFICIVAVCTILFNSLTKLNEHYCSLLFI